MASPASSPLKDNPYGEKFDNMEDDGRRFVVIHHGVGTHAQHKPGDGRAPLTAKDFGPGAQLPRLVGLGAIHELSASEIEQYEDALTAPDGGTPPVTTATPATGVTAAPGSKPPLAAPAGVKPSPNLPV